MAIITLVLLLTNFFFVLKCVKCFLLSVVVCGLFFEQSVFFLVSCSKLYQRCKWIELWILFFFYTHTSVPYKFIVEVTKGLSHFNISNERKLLHLAAICHNIVWNMLFKGMFSLENCFFLCVGRQNENVSAFLVVQ